MTWTDEAVAELRRLHEGGLFSCGEIAGRLATEFGQTVSRNSVIGKLLRLGLRNRSQKARTPAKPRPVRHAPFLAAPRRGRPPAPEPMPVTEVDDSAIPIEQRRTLMELTSETCKFPVGDPQDADFFFCGAKPRAGSVFCAAHHARCYQGSPPARPFVPMRNDRI